MGGLLLLLCSGTAVALATFYWFLAQTAHELDSFIVINYLRSYAGHLHALADREPTWTTQERAFLKDISGVFDHSIQLLSKGGQGIDLGGPVYLRPEKTARLLPPAPPEIVPDLVNLKNQ